MLTAFLLLVGCPRSTPVLPTVVEADADTDADADADADADSDADTDTAPIDGDGDGFLPPEDCDDSDATVFPGAPERCNGRDDACDGVDPGDEDADGDGTIDCSACDQAGWWALTVGISGQGLAQTLGTALDEPTCTYDDARLFMFETLDVMPDGMVYGVYTGVSAAPDGTRTPGDLNTEHTWPQSQGAGVEPAKCDLHHLYPTESTANSRRNNHPFGEVVTPSWTYGTAAFGTDANGTTVFQPPTGHRGNVARSLFYFGLQYGYGVDPAYATVLKSWSIADPVDERELSRTFAAATEQGGSENPLVVCPFLVQRL